MTDSLRVTTTDLRAAAILRLRTLQDLPPRPCLGSGFCCKQALCGVGVTRHGLREGPCPSLVDRDGRHYCGEVLAAQGLDRVHLERILYIGAGCCSPLNSDRARMVAQSKVWKAGDRCQVRFAGQFLDDADATVAEVKERGEPIAVEVAGQILRHFLLREVWPPEDRIQRGGGGR